MVDHEENNNNLSNNINLANNNQDDPEVGRMTCHHSPPRLAHMVRTPTNVTKIEIKTRLFQII